MLRWIGWGLLALLLAALFTPASLLGRPRPATVTLNAAPDGTGLRAGAAAINVTPFTLPGHSVSNDDPDWDGQISPGGVWGEPYVDTNENGRWDRGEPFSDDAENTALDSSADQVYNGIFLAGFHHGRIATGAADPIWARALVLESGSRRIAWVTVDVIGGFSHWIPAVQDYLRLAYPAVRVDEILLTFTHTHSGPDTVGMWGPEPLADGKYPRYLRYLQRQIARSIAAAAERMEPVRVVYGRATPGSHPDLAGMLVRQDCRAPWFLDAELRVMWLWGDTGTVATLINWSAHPVSLGRANTHISSDYAHTLRQTVEAQLGGVAIFVPGAIGGTALVGDACTAVWQREEFAGERFPVDPATGRPVHSIRRTRALGRVLGQAALAALENTPADPTATHFRLDRRELYVPLNNQALRLLAALGVLDLPTYLGGRVAADRGLGTHLRTRVYHLMLGQGSFLTAPGELFPELWYGVADHHRADIETAGTGRPFEPAVRPLQPGVYKFLVGNTPDLLGYVVPGYDFRIYGVPLASGIGLGALLGEAPDPATGLPVDPAYPQAVHQPHYHETVSAGAMFAPALTCTQAALLGAEIAAEPACREWDRWDSALGWVHNPLTFIHGGEMTRHY